MTKKNILPNRLWQSSITFLTRALLLTLLTCSALSQQANLGGFDGPVKVKIDVAKPLTFMAPLAMGIHTSVYDNHLMDPSIPSLLRATAITTLRYPGGGYADNYHWSTYKSTRWQAEEPPKYGYYAPNNDFGHFVSLIDKVGTAIIP